MSTTYLMMLTILKMKASRTRRKLRMAAIGPRISRLFTSGTTLESMSVITWASTLSNCNKEGWVRSNIYNTIQAHHDILWLIFSLKQCLPHFIEHMYSIHWECTLHTGYQMKCHIAWQVHDKQKSQLHFTDTLCTFHGHMVLSCHMLFHCATYKTKPLFTCIHLEHVPNSIG